MDAQEHYQHMTGEKDAEDPGEYVSAECGVGTHGDCDDDECACECHFERDREGGEA